MDPINLRLTETISVGQEFEASESELKEALDLLGEDDIRWEMVAYLVPRFEKLWARIDAAKLLTSDEYFGSNRDFLIEELKEMSLEKRAIAAEIRKKMQELFE